MAAALNKVAIRTMEKSKNLAKISKEELQETKEKRSENLPLNSDFITTREY